MVPFAWLFLFDSKPTNRGQPLHETHSAVIRLYIIRWRSLHVHFLTRALFDTTFKVIYQITLGENACIISRNKWVGRWEFNVFNLLLLLFYFSLYLQRTWKPKSLYFYVRPPVFRLFVKYCLGNVEKSLHSWGCSGFNKHLIHGLILQSKQYLMFN